jgi:hypothetical protein
MPGFESQKANLGSIGKNVWLGAVSRADVDGRANSGRLT